VLLVMAQVFPEEGRRAGGDECGRLLRQRPPAAAWYFPNLPLIDVGRKGRPTWWPLEVCQIVEAQNYMKQLSMEQIGVLGRHRLSPHQRKEYVDGVSVPCLACFAALLPCLPCCLACLACLATPLLRTQGASTRVAAS